MATFKFYQEIKYSIWQRTPFFIEAESYKEAVELAKHYVNDDVNDELPAKDLGDVENIWDTLEFMYPDDNDGYCTMVIIDDNDNTIAMNGK